MSGSNINNLSELYDYYYDELNKLFKEYNPCDIHKDKNGDIVCRGIKDKSNYEWDKHNILCCAFCNCNYNTKTHKYDKGHWDNGCTIKSLACKAFACYTVRTCKDKTVGEFRGKLFSLMREVYRHFPGLCCCYYKNKEQTINYQNNKRYQSS